LALYDDQDLANIDFAPPTANIAIPAMAAEDVLLFKNEDAALPGSSNLNPNVVPIPTDVCLFADGDDVILISSTNDADCYANRQDIIGTITGSAWGDDSAFIKGGCATETAHKDYVESDWIRVDLAAIDIADPNTNIALGTQAVGPTIFDGSGWSNLSPDQSREVIVSQSFNGADQTIEACNIIINQGVDVIFDSNGASNNSIIVYGDMTIDGSLTIGDTESLVTYDNDATLGVITKIEKSTELNDIHDVTYWSSPTQGAVLGEIFVGVDPTRIFELRPADSNPAYIGTIYEHWFNASGPMSEARGYAVEGSSVGIQTINFTGVPNNGNYTRDLYYKGSPDVFPESDNFNMIGNPYPAAIDIQKFLLNNAIVNEIFLWTHATPNPGGEYNPADYVTYNLSGGSSVDGVEKNIGSGQGFMIRTTDFGSVLFDNGLKLEGENDQFFKSNAPKKDIFNDQSPDRFWLTLSNNNGVRDEILIAFNDGSTEAFDPKFDSYYVNYPKDINLYSLIDDDKMVIQDLGAFDESKIVSIGFDTNKGSSFSMKLAKTEGIFKDSDVYLVDHVLNVQHDLKISDYSFDADNIGEYPNRFSLKFVSTNAVLGLDDLSGSNEFKVSNDFDLMKVKSGKTVDEIKVFDLLGRVIIHNEPKQKSFELSTGSVKLGTVMIIEARLEDGSFINTKSIKY
jgi:hypothetical protein